MDTVVGYVTADPDESGGEVEDLATRIEIQLADALGPSARFHRGEQRASRVSQIMDVLSPQELPSPAWLAQLHRNAVARTEFLDEFGALTSEQVAQLLGSRAKNARATASRLVAQGAIFSVEVASRRVFPGFQFSPATGAVRPQVGEVLANLPAALRSTDWQLALWWTTPSAWLDGQRPVDVLDTAPARVVKAAAQERESWDADNPTANL